MRSPSVRWLATAIPVNSWPIQVWTVPKSLPCENSCKSRCSKLRIRKARDQASLLTEESTGLDIALAVVIICKNQRIPLRCHSSSGAWKLHSQHVPPSEHRSGPYSNIHGVTSLRRVKLPRELRAVLALAFPSAFIGFWMDYL